jgi:hypothetical protein
VFFFLWEVPAVLGFVLFALVFSVLSCGVAGRGDSFSASAVRRRRSCRFPVGVVLGLALLAVFLLCLPSLLVVRVSVLALVWCFAA